MRINNFHVLTPFKVYSDPQDTRQVFLVFFGIVHEFLLIKHAEDDINRVHHLARTYYYLSGFLKTLNRPLAAHKKTSWVPNLWYDLKAMEESIAAISYYIDEWLKGEELNTFFIISELEKMTCYMNNLCQVFDMKPETLLTICDISMKKDLALKTLKLPQPFHKKKGRPPKHQTEVAHAQLLTKNRETKLYKTKPRLTRPADKKSVADKAWLRIFKIV